MGTQYLFRVRYYQSFLLSHFYKQLTHCFISSLQSSWFPTFLELLDDRDLYLRVAAGENIALMLEMNESAVRVFSLKCFPSLC